MRVCNRNCGLLLDVRLSVDVKINYVNSNMITNFLLKQKKLTSRRQLKGNTAEFTEIIWTKN
jgi:hypothetical protein